MADDDQVFDDKWARAEVHLLAAVAASTGRVEWAWDSLSNTVEAIALSRDALARARDLLGPARRHP